MLGGGRVKGETRKSMQLSHPILLERGYIVRELLGIGAEGDVVRCERIARYSSTGSGGGDGPRPHSARVSMRLTELVSRRSSQQPSPRSSRRQTQGGAPLMGSKRESNASSGIASGFNSGRFKFRMDSERAQATASAPSFAGMISGSAGNASSFENLQNGIKDESSSANVLQPMKSDNYITQLPSMDDEDRAVAPDAPTSVAVKIISRAYTERENCEPAVIRELDILRTVRHPHIVTFVETFSNSKHWYLVTEILRGGDLFDAAVRKTFSELQTAEVAIQVLSALAYLHKLGIAHRDIKLENIVYSKKNSSEVKLIDFGLAWRREDHVRRMIDEREKLKKGKKKKKKDKTKEEKGDDSATKKASVGSSFVTESSSIDIDDAVAKDPSLVLVIDEFPGSSAYESPEIVLRKPHSAEMLDVWSTGVVLYALINKKFPFTGDTRKQVQKAIVYKEPSFAGQVWSDVSEEFKKFLLKMLSKDPSQRPSAESCCEFFEELQQKLTSEDALHSRNSAGKETPLIRASTRFKVSVGNAFGSLGKAIGRK